jgi:hypothetical protein
MRASHIALIVTMLAIPSVAYSQQDGPVGGRVGPDLGSSPTQPGPSAGAHPYGSPPRSGPLAGNSGSVMPGQVMPQNVPVYAQPGGTGSAFVDGHRVLVDQNSNRILRVLN